MGSTDDEAATTWLVDSSGQRLGVTRIDDARGPRVRLYAEATGYQREVGPEDAAKVLRQLAEGIAFMDIASSDTFAFGLDEDQPRWFSG